MKRVTTTFTAGVFAMLATALILSCALSGPRPVYYSESSGELVYYDSLAYEGKTYKTIKMPDGKVWMAENLNHAVGNSKCNKDVLYSTGYTAGSGRQITFCDEYGSFYNWEDAMKACPAGWHLPTKGEWNKLTAAIGGKKVAGKVLKSTYTWQKEGNQGIDKYGFKVGGAGNYASDSVINFGLAAYFWTSSEYKADSANKADSAKVLTFYSGDDSRGGQAEKNLAFLSVRCVEGPVPAPAPVEPITDARDNKTYKTVEIDEQVWMAENLDYAGEDGSLGACYDKKPENCKKYGSLYNWANAMKACPAGWHLPTTEEWDELVNFAGGPEKAGTQLKAKDGWNAYDFSKKSPNAPECKWTEETKEEIDNRGEIVKPAGVVEHDACHTDKYGFAALPGGYGGSDGFGEAGSSGGWWSASEESDGLGNRYSAYGHKMYYNSESTMSKFKEGFLAGLTVRWINYNKGVLFSVRCVKD